MDKGSEMRCRAIAEWPHDVVNLTFIPPGEPWKKGYVESFHSRQREEFLSITTFPQPAACLRRTHRLEHRIQPPATTLKPGPQEPDRAGRILHLHQTRWTPNKTERQTGGGHPNKPAGKPHTDHSLRSTERAVCSMSLDALNHLNIKPFVDRDHVSGGPVAISASAS